jgi:hypothetical protein
MVLMEQIIGFLRRNFVIPNPMNWGYPVLFAGIGSIISFLVSKAAFNFLPFSSTSIVGCTLITILFVLAAFIMPAVFLSGMTSDDIAGRYTGIGVLLMSFLSGAPVYLIDTACRNIITYLWMRSGNSVVFPLTFYYNAESGLSVLGLEFLTDTLIPAIGMSLFFYGLLWSCFKPSQRKAAALIIPLLYAAFSFDFLGLVGVIVTGWWLLTLRRNIDNIWGPILCLIGSRATGIIIGSIISPVDITSLRTYQDISISCFYAAAPAIVVAVILFAFFLKTLGEFNYTYNNSIYGDNLDADYLSSREHFAPSALKGFNVAALIGVIICAVIWIMLYKGVRP